MELLSKSNASRNRRAPWKKLKRCLAVGMAALMMVTSPMPGLHMVSLANTTTPELRPDPTMKENSAGLTTAYKWNPKYDYTLDTKGHFDLEGIKDASNINKDGGYTNDRIKGVITTYAHRGYETIIKTGDSNSDYKELRIPKNGGVETIESQHVDLQMKVYPSPDRKWIFVDYIVCNRLNRENTVQIASGTDVQVGGLSGGGSGDPADASTLVANDVGFHMVNSDLNNGAKGTYESFDLKYKDPILGLTPPDSKWVGKYSARSSNYFTNTPHTVRDEDSGLTYSWTIKLKPLETQLRRVAFAAKGPSYYISDTNGADTNTGADNAPLKTIEAAMGKIGNKVGYIYIQDYAQVDRTITVAPGANITFMSADYDFHSQPTSDIVTLTRKEGFTGPMFTTSGGTMQFGSLTLDGGGHPGSWPLLTADSGKIGVQRDGVLQNNKVSEAGKGSAIDLTGSASLEMNFGKITQNESKDRGAVNFNSTGTLTLQNQVDIKDNTSEAGKPANVYLPEGKHVSVAGDLADSQIGVTTGVLPRPSANGISTEANQEVKVAAPTPEYVVGGSPPFVDNFKPDDPGIEGANLYMSAGTAFPGSGNEKNAVLKKNGFQLIFNREVKETGSVVPATKPLPTMIVAGGDSVSLDLSGSDPQGSGVADKYTRLKEVRIEPAGGLNFTPSADPGGILIGKLEGTMPKEDVTVTYLYKVSDTTITFHSNEGTPTPDPVSGKAGDPNGNLLPSVSRYGYDFTGWSKNNDRAHPQMVTDSSTEWTTFPEGNMDLYAIFEPDGSDPPIQFDYIKQYVNEDGSISFQDDVKDKKKVEAPITADYQEIHGYRLDGAETVPDQYNYGSPIPNSSDPAISGGRMEDIGRFDGNHDFKGYMPGQSATVRYRYKVDEAVRSDLVVRHVLEGTGAQAAPDQTFPYSAESTLEVSPLSQYGFECLKGEVTSGTKENPTEPRPAGPLTGVTGAFDSAYKFTGTMPNQKVVITYTYEATGGYPLTINYLDDGTLDPALKKLPGTTVKHFPPDGAVAETYEEPYGYQLAAKAMTPTGGRISWNGSGNDFAGSMPSDEVTVTYDHGRRSDKWADVTFTYDKVVNGTLARGSKSSVDLKDGPAEKSFHSSILINDGSDAGGRNAYTLRQIAQKGLSPDPVADENYEFDGWFVDGNHDGLLNDGETLHDETTTLSAPSDGALTLTAHFKKDPDKWGDITLRAGENGSIQKDGASIDSMTLNVSLNQTWSGISGQLPKYEPAAAGASEIKPVANYLPKGWYQGGIPVAQDEALSWGKTYTIEFKKDPAFFGTDPATPEVSAGLDGLGRGRAAVLDWADGYQYILADLNGKVLAVQKGNPVRNLAFLDLQPGSRYEIYEAPEGSPVTAGSDAAHVTGASSPAQILVPVVDGNYQVYYDDDQDGKVVLAIGPADKKSEYALLDANGDVVHAPQTGQTGWLAPQGNPGSLSLSGLEYNKRYTVVARPKGALTVTPESKMADGSAITTDPGGALELPTFVVETEDSGGGEGHGGVIQKIVRKTPDGSGTQVVEGSEDTAYFKDAQAGDRVYLSADDGDGSFDHWELTMGSVKNLNMTIHSPEVNFEMPQGNLVFTAVYKRTASPSNAKVTDEVRGSGLRQLALVRGEIPRLEEELTTDKDRQLHDVNHATVTYRVVYQKTSVKATDSDAIKEVSEAYGEHPDSFKSAFGLNVSIERYVGNRKVGATPSNAAFKTYVQLESDDVDMTDYQLYDVTPNPSGRPVLESWLPDDAHNPEATGGLFTFKAQAGHRYVLSYSKAYRMRFKNETLKNEGGGADFNYSFKVRRNERPLDSYYRDDYGRVTDYENGLDSQFTSGGGVIYTKEGWSYKRGRLVEFDPGRPLTRKTTIYMHYKDDALDVENARQELEAYVAKILDMSDDHFLRGNEGQELKEFVRAAQDVLDMEAPNKATQEDLMDALTRLGLESEPYAAKLKARYEDYHHKQEGGNKGGGGSGGGGGGGTTHRPYNATRPASYRIGTNGNWVEEKGSDGKTTRMTFVLNGGMLLRDMWAMLEYPEDSSMKDGNGAALTGSGWYHFNDQGFVETGWISDAGTWYYCGEPKDGGYAKMVTGWKQDGGDGRWYYLDPKSGAMATGWKEVGGKWYYLNPVGAGVYAYDATKGQWVYGGGGGRPLGAMYKDEVTPDGYTVGPDGAWIQ